MAWLGLDQLRCSCRCIVGRSLYCEYPNLILVEYLSQLLEQECGAYITGGNFSGFKQILESYYDFAFPIAEIASDGTFVITKQENNFNGIVTVETVRSQILYEIQGNVRAVYRYFWHI